MRIIYIICPGKNCTKEVNNELEKYVEKLEDKLCIVHFPPRDVDQSLSGRDICKKHREAMWAADEIHIWWDPESKGSYVDFGMAYMRKYDKPSVKFCLINVLNSSSQQSYGNVIIELCEEDKINE